MKRILIFLALLPFSIFAQENSKELELLANYMSGSFNSSLQAKSDTNYLNIRLDMKRIWAKKNNGIWLYVEQAMNKADAKPYRQRVYHLQQINDKQFSSTIYKIDSAEKYIGDHLNKTTQLSDDKIEVLEGCALTLDYDGNKFKGATKKGDCLNSWGKAAYATSEVEIRQKELISWDRGWNDKDEYVWGAEHAGYKFIKQ